MGSVVVGSSEELQLAAGSNPLVVCVTGSTGYVGSWLVRTLLRRGYRVHATARDTGKAWQVFAAVEGRDRLRVFRADMGEEGSFDAAVRGCVALFHVAASMELHVPPGQDNVEERVRSSVLEPATRGAINVLQSCVRSGTIRRVVFTSSISTMTAADAEGRRKVVVDESCLRALDDVWRTKPVGWVYILSKLLTEEAAFRFAREKGVHLVSVILPTVAGPFLTPSVPTSIQLLLSPITGDPKLYSLLASVHSRFGCIPLSHIQDVCDAHVFLLETPRAEGRYLCAAGSHPMPQVAQLLASRHPPFRPAERLSRDFDASDPSVVSSKRLVDLGFKFEHDAGETVMVSVAQCVDHGFLKNPKSCN
ncbi:dihydroflavonol 4-reductase-like isoform X2 [Phragmites australis]|uniref:dihydroflavonol 4-reductase-like isoform X2 n=1 Tax=Phragmites australis TaxID=29695 RepID=UPI002D79D412|nr:dihydroflavonol 4-reductase-like isoform X2 [Phragmites australis]